MAAEAPRRRYTINHESSATVCRWHEECERKVRAAQDAPLVKVPAVGDSRIREKKITARKGKGEKVV